MTDATEQSGNYTSAIVFATLTILCIVGAIANLLAPNLESFALALGIGALIFGNMSFNRFEKASAPGPPPQEFHEIDTFVSKLMDGTDVTFGIQIKFVAQKPSPSAMEQIKYQVLRRLNETLSLLGTLYEQPLPVTDHIIQKDIPDLCKELNLERLVLRTIEVKGGSPSATHHSQGIYFGEHMQ